MKHAITTPDGGITRVCLQAREGSVEITDEQAQLVLDGEKSQPAIRYMIYNGQFMTRREAFRSKIPVHPKPPRKATKLTLMRRLDELGKWTTFKAIMSSMPEVVQDAWMLAQEVNESDPLFATNKEAFLSALGVTEEQLSALFDS